MKSPDRGHGVGGMATADRMGVDMQINQAGLDLIKRFEGLRLDAYQDVAGIWTIGYGHTKSVKPGMRITPEQADAFLREDLKDAEQGVQGPVKVPISSNEFSALVSLVYNIGRGAFSKSTALKLLNKGDRLGAADAIELWNKSTVNGKKVVVAGLAARRAAEKGLFLTPTADAALPTLAQAVLPSKKAAAPSQTPANAAPDNGPATRIKPTVESSRQRRDNLGASRTIQGATATAATGAAAAGTGASAETHQKNQYVQEALDYIHAHGNELLIIIGVILVVAALWIIAARIDDWVHNRR